MTPSQSQQEQNATTQSTTQQDTATKNQNQVASNNTQLNGAVQDTGYYQNEVKSGTGAVTAGYDANKRNLKASMEAAGVSGRSGVDAGNTTAMAAQEASDLGKVKTNAYADTESQQLAANAQDLTASGQQTGAATNYSQQANQAEEERQKIGSANWAALGSAVTAAASPFGSALAGKIK